MWSQVFQSHVLFFELNTTLALCGNGLLANQFRNEARTSVRAAGSAKRQRADASANFPFCICASNFALALQAVR